ncbi:MAG: outer membrane protein assembly factor BamA [Alphaproteobacteria bacterium]|nr:outer membrane protein assembly factor BamA [Alphaproteobacteria bacterium]
MRYRVVFIGLLALGLFLSQHIPYVGLTHQAQAQSNSVSRIVVEGNQRIEAETVRSYMQIRAGDSFSPDLIDESLQTLFQTGLFSDVRIFRRGSNLVVSVEENPIINRIAFEGNSALKNEALQKEIDLKPRVVFTRARVQADVDRIITLYRRSGQFNARVEPKIIRLPQNRIDLVFEITEGAKTVVQSISFIGNRKFSDGQLRSVIVTEQTTFWKFWSNADTYDPDRLNYDKELLRRHYLKNGYADFRVLSGTAELAPNGQDFFLTFSVEEGEQYKFGEISVNPGQTELDPQALMAEVTTFSGETYDASKVDKSIEKLTLEAGKRGFAFAQVRPKIERVANELVINLVYEMNEGPRVYIERIDIVGNVRTLDKVVRREIRLVEGDAYNRILVDRARRRITSLDYFEKVDILEQPGSSPDKVVLIFQVAEKSTGTLNFSAGYSTTEQVLGSVSISERNLLGRGYFTSLATSLSFKRQSVDFSFADPYFLDQNMSAGVNAFTIETDQQDESSFNSRETGGGFSFGFPISENARLRFSYGFTNRDIKRLGAAASAAIRVSAGVSNKSQVGVSYTYNTLDNPLAPTQGLRAALSADLAGVGGDVFFWRVSGKASYFHSITDGVVLNLKGSGGAMDGFNGKFSPVLDRFFKGGNSFRGFERAGIGPRDTAGATSNDAVGGQIFAIGTVETTFPLGLPEAFGVRGAVFTDIGTLFDAPGPAAAFGTVRDSSTLRVSAGVGVLWNSPFGPVRLDYAEAVQKHSLDKTQRIQFSAGASF